MVKVTVSYPLSVLVMVMVLGPLAAVLAALMVRVMVEASTLTTDARLVPAPPAIVSFAPATNPLPVMVTERKLFWPVELGDSEVTDGRAWTLRQSVQVTVFALMVVIVIFLSPELAPAEAVTVKAMLAAVVLPVTLVPLIVRPEPEMLGTEVALNPVPLSVTLAVSRGTTLAMLAGWAIVRPWEKFAVTELTLEAVTVQLLAVPLQAPDQPVKL